MKKKIVLAIKSGLATVFVLLNLVLMLKIANEGRKTTQGKEVMVSLNHKKIYVKNGEEEYLIEPNKKNMFKIFSEIYSKPLVLPCPLNFYLISKNLMDGFF